jgi:sirohydrochlorin cobaltochelatase
MKTAILLAAYGATGVQNTKSLGCFEQLVCRHFPGVCVRWAFTSPILRKRLVEAGKKTDSVYKALCRLGFENFTHITVQSLHIIPGKEYRQMQEEIALAANNGAPAHISVGLPLLNTDTDIETAAGALLQSLPLERHSDEIVIWAGHGGAHTGKNFYELLGRRVQNLDKNILISTLEEGVAQILPKIQRHSGTKIWLLPLLSVAGRHSVDDLAGNKDSSWRRQLELNNYPCTPVIRGLIEYPAFTNIWIQHLRKAHVFT